MCCQLIGFALRVSDVIVSRKLNVKRDASNRAARWCELKLFSFSLAHYARPRVASGVITGCYGIGSRKKSIQVE